MAGAILRWTARLIGLGLAAFLGLMALDTPLGLGLLIHLVPCLFVLILVFVGWRRPVLGGWLFSVAGVAATVFFHTYRHPLNFIVVSGPFFLSGLLFFLSGRK